MTDYPPYDRRRRNLLELLPPTLQPGPEVWRWATIGVYSLRMVLGVLLAVIGTGLAGMGIGLALGGFGLLTLDLAPPESEVLAVGVAVLMLGAAVIGLAVEGGLGLSGRRVEAEPWETLLTWTPAILVGIWLTARLADLATSTLARFSELFDLVPAYLDVVGGRAWPAALIALALAWPALQYGAPRYPWIAANVPSLLYAPWIVLVILEFRRG